MSPKQQQREVPLSLGPKPTEDSIPDQLDTQEGAEQFTHTSKKIIINN